MKNFKNWVLTSGDMCGMISNAKVIKYEIGGSYVDTKKDAEEILCA